MGRIPYSIFSGVRGGAEKFHGAVMTHSNRNDTRVLGDVRDLGGLLGKLDAVVGTSVAPEVAVVYDNEVQWAVDLARGPRAEKKDYAHTCMKHYQPFWAAGIPVDAVHQDADFSKYKLVITPMLYLLRPGAAERLAAFVEAGGIWVSTYWSGVADEYDRCFLNGDPDVWRKCRGIRVEEMDVLYDADTVPVRFSKGNRLGLKGVYDAQIFCELSHLESAQALAVYDGEFYSGRPALTEHRHGKGTAYYIAFRGDDAFHRDFYGALIKQAGLERVLPVDLPDGVTVQKRTDGKREFVFVVNFSQNAVAIPLNGEVLRDMDSDKRCRTTVKVAPHDARVFEKVEHRSRCRSQPGIIATTI